MSKLREIIRREIEACGAIPFARFMELSLYCPEFGYYERLANTPGKGGDFYTSVSVGSLFAELLAFQFAGWVEKTGLDRFQLLEAGSADGRLAADVLNWFKSRRPHLLERMEYWILEPSLRRREWQKKNLEPLAAPVRWFDSWDKLPAGGVRGVIFSNELLDAMPAHRIGWNAQNRNWFEWGVGFEAENFVWIRRLPDAKHQGPVAFDTPRSILRKGHLPTLPAELLAVLPDGFTTETSPAAVEWWRQAATVLNEGTQLTFDYGLTAEEFFAPHRAKGTLRAYHGHRPNDDLLANVGEQDLTAHVNFTALQSAGESAGLKTEGLFSQAEFLKRVAESAWHAQSAFGGWTAARTRQFQTLTHPEHLGRSLEVLVQTR